MKRGASEHTRIFSLYGHAAPLTTPSPTPPPPGYLIQYENNFNFATVRGAGHMVPETRSEASLAMMSAFVLGKRL